MGDHIVDGRFVSDKYAVLRLDDWEDATPDKLVLSFNDPAARAALKLFANMTGDEDLAAAIKARLRTVEPEDRRQGSDAVDREGPV